MHRLTFFGILFFFLLTSCDPGNSDNRLNIDLSSRDLKTHISYLAADELKGRVTGSPGSAKAANYIADQFREFGLNPLESNQTYFQEFTANMNVLNNPHSDETTQFEDEKRLARNVVAIQEGTSHPERFVVIGAHFDHLGMGKFGSLYSRDDPQIHNGADDNASGTAGLLELAQYFSRRPTGKSLVYVAFSGEEMGLLGSRHFVENPPIPLEQIDAMINLDMVGRLNEQKLLIFGTGTSDDWPAVLDRVQFDSLNIETIQDGTGASDHTSFYNKKIPVLHYFTDTHADYHRPSDDPEFINYQGEQRVLRHLVQVINTIDTLSAGRLQYTEAPVTQQRDVTLDGPTLGVTPDYGFSGDGMRITGTRTNGPADRAGLSGGDIITAMAGKAVEDIYKYMEILNSLEKGQTATITILRNGEELTFEIEL